MRRILALIVSIGALAALGLGAAPASASNCQVSVSPFMESSLFGGAEAAAQVTFYNCTDVSAVKVRYQYNGNLAVTSGMDNTVGSNPKPFHYYQGVNACGSNGLQPVPAPPPSNAGVDFVCQASGTICGSLSSGCSMWGYTAAHWWTGCRSITAGFQVSLKSFAQGTFGPFNSFQAAANLC